MKYVGLIVLWFALVWGGVIAHSYTKELQAAPIKVEKNTIGWEVFIYSNGKLILKDETKGEVNYTKTGITFYNLKGMNIIAENVTWLIQGKEIQ